MSLQQRVKEHSEYFSMNCFLPAGMVCDLFEYIKELEQGPCRFDCRKGYPKQIKLLRITVQHCKEKLEINWDHTKKHEYHGGIEYAMLMKMIATTLKMTEEKK